MRKHNILLIIITLVFCLSVAPSATAASDEEEIIQVETNFIKAYTTGDFELMSSLYWHSSKTSTFFPGTQPLLGQGWDELLENRWKSIFASPAVNTTITFHHPQVTMIKDDVAVITGYECVANTDPTTQEEVVSHNRVTRVVKKIRGKWLIVHDHVSQVPVE